MSYFWGNNLNAPELWPSMLGWKENYKQIWAGASISRGVGRTLNTRTGNYFIFLELMDYYEKQVCKKNKW